MVTPLIEGRDLDTYYGQSHILRAVSFSVCQGETVGLMGRNGMGKTTLIRTLMGLVPPRRGSVFLDGEDVTFRRTNLIAQRGVSYVPEGRGIFATLTVEENLRIAERRGIDGRADWTYARILEIFPRLAERIHHHGDQLSGGEQQMLAIGRALLSNPRLLILDEATEGLAPIIRDEIWRIVRLIRDTGIATLIVDKTVSAVADIADRAVILVKGEVVFDASPAQLKASPELMRRHLGV